MLRRMVTSGEIPMDLESPQTDRRRALIIESEQFDADEIERHLRDEGWGSVAVTSPQEARAVLRVQSFNIIFMDLQFPGDVDGYSFSRELRQHADTQHVPVIFLTDQPVCSGTPACLLKSRPGECVTHIVKNVSLEAIRNALKISCGLNGYHGSREIKRGAVVSVAWLFWLTAMALGHGWGNGWLFKLIKSFLNGLAEAGI